MKIITLLARIFVGLIFTVFGSNGFLHFIKMPDMPDSLAKNFTTAMMNSGYFTVIAALQVIGGLCVLSGRFLNLGVFILGPIVLNIFLFHLFLEPNGLGMAVALLVATLILAFHNRKAWLATLLGR